MNNCCWVWIYIFFCLSTLFFPSIFILLQYVHVTQSKDEKFRANSVQMTKFKKPLGLKKQWHAWKLEKQINPWVSITTLFLYNLPLSSLTPEMVCSFLRRCLCVAVVILKRLSSLSLVICRFQTTLQENVWLF